MAYPLGIWTAVRAPHLHPPSSVPHLCLLQTACIGRPLVWSSVDWVMKLKVCDVLCCSVWFQEALVGYVRRISSTPMGRKSLWTPASSQCRTTLHTFPLKSLTSPSLTRSDTILALRWVSWWLLSSIPDVWLNHLWTNEILFSDAQRFKEPLHRW